jgi:hypothetical protein
MKSLQLLSTLSSHLTAASPLLSEYSPCEHLLSLYFSPRVRTKFIAYAKLRVRVSAAVILFMRYEDSAH